MDNFNMQHSGTKGMRWGYTDGKRNGKRTAGEGFDLKTYGHRTFGLDGYMLIPGLNESKKYSKERYYIKEDTEDSDWVEVDKDTYDSTPSGTHLYYNGKLVSEIVSDFAKETIENIQDTISDIVTSGKNFLDSFLNKK